MTVYPVCRSHYFLIYSSDLILIVVYLEDMSAARHADLLFVKQKPGADNDLAAFCRKEGIPHVQFEDFNRALDLVKQVVEKKLSVKEALAVGTA